MIVELNDKFKFVRGPNLSVSVIIRISPRLNRTIRLGTKLKIKPDHPPPATYYYIWKVQATQRLAMATQRLPYDILTFRAI